MHRLDPLRWLVLACTAVLAACTLPAPVVPPTAAPAAPIAPAAPALQAPRYNIDPAATTLHILVYRGGRLASLGHNHVVSSRTVSGSVWRGASLADSGFAITVPVNALIVDDNNARAAEGADFPLNVTEDAKQGTKTNMLRDTLLDGARYPDITLQSVSVQGDIDAPQVVAALRIKDQTRQIAVPVALRMTDGTMHIRGEFDMKQSDFGITPLSIALGALVVQDTVKIKFELVAKRAALP